ncbi:MAG: hypothetical protein ACE5GB_05705, partial [Acidimicrobiales bacterium]
MCDRSGRLGRVGLRAAGVWTGLLAADRPASASSPPAGASCEGDVVVGIGLPLWNDGVHDTATVGLAPLERAVYAVSSPA